MKKWTFGSIAFLLVAIIAAGILFPNLYENQLKDALENQVRIQTDSTYSVELNNLDISFWERSISGDSLTITPSNDLEPIKLISASSIQIKGVKWWTLLFNRFASFGTILVEDPFIEVYSRPLKIDTFQQSDSSNMNSSDLALSKFNFIIKNGKARLVEPSGRTEVMLEEFSLMATEVNISQILDGSRLPFLKELILKGRGLTWRLDEQLYRFEIGEFSFDRIRRNAIVKEIALTPVLPRYEFSRIKGYSTDRIELEIDKLTFKDLSLDSLFIPRIQIGEIAVEKGSIDVFKTKTIPSRSAIGYRALLSDEVSKVNIQLGIDSIFVNNLDVSYTEHKEDALEPGKIFFKDISGIITDINTPGFPGFNEETTKMKVSTNFMGTSKLDLNVDYPLFDSDEVHHVWGNMEKLETKTVNAPLLHLAFVETKSGIINSMNFDFKADNRNARGELLFDYEDLALTFLKSDDTDGKDLGTRLKSLLTNTLGLNKNNTGEDMSSSEIDYTWDKRKGVFGYWWQALLSGVKDSIR